jgi:sortase (surface protein transpeptidase)
MIAQLGLTHSLVTRQTSLVAIDATGLDGATRRYRVTGTEIVRWNRFAIGAGTDVRELALVTCYPFGAAGHGPVRYVVRAVAARQAAPANRRGLP